MPFSNTFVISCRSVSLLIILALAYSMSVGEFTYRAIFIGLLFSHFALGFYYSKNNLLQMKEKKYALMLATAILMVGLYFSLYVTHLAPYFLVLHVALSEAYLLTIRTRLKDPEHMALLRTVFYIAVFGLMIIPVGEGVATGLSVVGLTSFAVIVAYTQNRLSLLLFEAPLLAVATYAKITGMVFEFHYLGFYHILTWYVFSFWMLFVKEKNMRKGVSFFSMVFALSAVFVVLFDSVLGLAITDKSFVKIIGTWSILHIFSSIPLSKLNPRFLKDLFYPAQKGV
ncbi:hypothetical protein [Paremcibacter congregatus]|uniref:Uncharacterized protein n=1 Tax=Paremcibacter congregatus TaxID=2043170 RepID=A0A2G4YQ29_9PROT|nr:hypothetical protein [Paremcibacter congregatus]PHZ84429.1 hypothetical protein CRD36_11490 [Paremcibacter congregatus]QDE28647.1 hypothetical protein FIV45_15900 [Paremcibacter congregatus]